MMLAKRFWLVMAVIVLSAVMASCATPTGTPTPQSTSMPVVIEPGSTSVPPTVTQESPASVPEISTGTPELSTPAPEPAALVEGEGMTWEADGVVVEGEYTDQVEIAGVTLAWMTDTDYLYGAMWAKTEGWVAVGFDPEQRMQGANYVFGFVQDGEVFIADMFGTKPVGPDSHPPDTTLGGTDDLQMFGGREEDGVTLIEFKIPRDSGDAYDKPLTPGRHVLITAFGPTDDFGTRHTNRGGGEIMID